MYYEKSEKNASNTIKDNKKTIYELAREEESNVFLAKCSLTNYLYQFTFSSHRGLVKSILKVDIFDEDTGEELTGSLDAFNYEMANLPIWEFTEINEQND